MLLPWYSFLTFHIFFAYDIESPIMRSDMNHCSHLYFLSAIACKLSECLSEQELSELSADLVVLSDLIANILVHQNQT